VTSPAHRPGTSRPWACVVPALIAALVQAPDGASAQPVLPVDSTIACASCSIGFGEPVRLEGQFEDGALQNVGPVIRGPDGRFFVFYEGDRTYIDVFTPEGRSAGQRIGRTGDGPGEFRTIALFRVDGERLFAYDLALQRATLFDLASGDIGATLHLPPHTDALMLPDGRHLLSGAVRTREGAGYPLHLHGPDGAWLASFGVDTPRLSPGGSAVLWRALAPAGSTGFWAAPPNEYRVELWGHDQVLQRTLLAQRAWFEKWETRVPFRSRTQPPETNLFQISIDEEGLLWVLLIVADERWREAVGTEVDERGTPVLVPGIPYRRMVLEVIDPAEGKLLARHRFEPFLSISFAAPGYLTKSWSDGIGLPRAEVIPVRLRRVPASGASR
jgi:hypothetical protein